MNTFDPYLDAARTGWDRARRLGIDLYERLRDAGPWQLALGAVVALFLLTLVLPLVVTAAVIAFLLVLVAVWIHEFLALMRLTDNDFPGRFDKLVWSIVMIVFAPVGLIAFAIYRRRRWPDDPPLWESPPPPKSNQPWDRDAY